MADESPELPQGDGICVALHKESSKENNWCEWPARILEGNLLCLRHAKALRRDPQWPLRENYERYREAILEALRELPEKELGKSKQARKSEAKESKLDKTGDKQRDSVSDFLGRFLDIKVVGTALILLAAFVSEFLFLLPFDIDYSFYIGTVEAVPLFIRNLAFILMVCIGVFAALCVLVVVLETKTPAKVFATDALQDEKLKILTTLVDGLRNVKKSKKDSMT